MTAKEYKAHLLTQFDSFKAGLNGNSAKSFYKGADAYYADLKKLDFPTKRHEEWKYTNLDRVLKKAPKIASLARVFEPEWANESLIEGLDAYKLVLHNGVLHSKEDLPNGVVLKTAKLNGELDNASPIDKDDIFENINRAFAGDGLEISVEANVKVEKPIYIVNIIDANADAIFAQRNLKIKVAKSAQVTFIERIETKGAHTSLTNCLTEISVGANADVHHIVLQNDLAQASQVCRTYINQSRDSRYSNYTYSISGEIVRNNVTITLDGENSTGNLYGLYLLDGKEHVDNHTLVDHKMPNCESNELYKGVLNGNATGVFNGKVFVRQDAQKTNAYQQNRNLLLSDNATINTKPQLEIWADDVKCSHGCTVGQLDHEQMFYLQTRGISKEAAQNLMVYAFASEIVERLPVEAIRLFLLDKIAKKLAFNFE